MPRLHSSLVRNARSIDPLLTLLLPVCRTLPSARNELRWLREHAVSKAKNQHEIGWPLNLEDLCRSRGRGWPLQYILGTQSFGNLEINCEPGVLIPRPETESWTTSLAYLLQKYAGLRTECKKRLRILDLCTGSGCIPLLLHSLLDPDCSASDLQFLGIDKEPQAIFLAARNILHNVNTKGLAPEALQHVKFRVGDIFSEPQTEDKGSWAHQEWDILISNPPYISPQGFKRTTERSVRIWEPKSALVPPSDPWEACTGRAETVDKAIGDSFYQHLLNIAAQVKAKIVCFEVADIAQATRVGSTVGKQGYWEQMEIWRDWAGSGGKQHEETIDVDKRSIKVLGEGEGRVVIAWTVEGGKMIGR